MLAHAEAVRFSAGDVLVSAGELDRTLYVLASGRLEVLLPGEGDDIRIGTIEQRSVAGEIAFVDGRPRSVTLRALTDGDVLDAGAAPGIASTDGRGFSVGCSATVAT